MSTIVKAAAVQISPVLYSREGTVARVVRKIHQLGQQGVQFATFPETVVPYYPYFSAVQTPAKFRVDKPSICSAPTAICCSIQGGARRIGPASRASTARSSPKATYANVSPA